MSESKFKDELENIHSQVKAKFEGHTDQPQRRLGAINCFWIQFHLDIELTDRESNQFKE